MFDRGPSPLKSQVHDQPLSGPPPKKGLSARHRPRELPQEGGLADAGLSDPQRHVAHRQHLVDDPVRLLADSGLSLPERQEFRGRPFPSGAASTIRYTGPKPEELVHVSDAAAGAMDMVALESPSPLVVTRRSEQGGFSWPRVG